MQRRVYLVLFLILGLANGSPVAGQQPPGQEQAMPDSTYLWLTMELPDVATFAVRRVLAMRGGEGVQIIQQHLMSLSLVQCSLRWRHSRRTDDGRRISRVIYYETSVPLKELDLKHVEARPAIRAGESMPDAEHYEVMMFSSNRKTRPFLVKNLDNGMQRHERMIGLEVYGQQNARRVADLLADAAQRCDSWNTAPLRPIRSF
jgi:hypothetical protein